MLFLVVAQYGVGDLHVAQWTSLCVLCVCVWFSIVGGLKAGWEGSVVE